jgi:hypothetical protein
MRPDTGSIGTANGPLIARTNRIARYNRAILTAIYRCQDE